MPQGQGVPSPQPAPYSPHSAQHRCGLGPLDMPCHCPGAGGHSLRQPQQGLRYFLEQGTSGQSHCPGQPPLSQGQCPPAPTSPGELVATASAPSPLGTGPSSHFQSRTQLASAPKPVPIPGCAQLVFIGKSSERQGKHQEPRVADGTGQRERTGGSGSRRSAGHNTHQRAEPGRAGLLQRWGAAEQGCAWTTSGQ